MTKVENYNIRIVIARSLSDVAIPLLKGGAGVESEASATLGEGRRVATEGV